MLVYSRPLEYRFTEQMTVARRRCSKPPSGRFYGGGPGALEAALTIRPGGSNLRALGVDVKVAQELLRHANSRTTMDLYTQAVSAEKRNASLKQVELLLA